jgi:biotin carboxyl carrier protein
MKLRITVEGKQYEVDVEVLDEGQAGAPSPAPTGGAKPAKPAAQAQPSESAQPAAPSAASPAAPAGGGEVTAPVAGSVFDVKVKAGDQVQQNDTLLVLEAMKMESNVPAPQSGTVAEVLVNSGDSVTAGQVLVRLE